MMAFIPYEHLAPIRYEIPDTRGNQRDPHCGYRLGMRPALAVGPIEPGHFSKSRNFSRHSANWHMLGRPEWQERIAGWLNA